MFKNTRKNLLVVLFSFLVANTASATRIDFSAATLNEVASTAYNSVGLVVDDIDVTVTAYTIINDGNGAITSLTRLDEVGTGVYVSSSDNLGVRSHSDDGSYLDGGDGFFDPITNIDYDEDEGLLFSFDQQVSLDFVDFDRFGGDDDFNLTVDGTLYLVDFYAGDFSVHANQAALGDSSEFDFHNVVGTEFLFWADGDSDGFKIDAFEVTAVPEPTSIILLAIALLVLAQRKKQLNG